MNLRRILLLGLVVALLWGMAERRMVVARVASALLPAPELEEATDQGPDARWVDDDYTVEALDERTFAIGEPRYAQRNFSYLIVGSERAVLFDAGPGVRDIRPIAESLTPGPLFAFLPGSGMGDYLEGAEAILRSAPSDPRILGAHRSELSGLPELTLGDVEDLETLLQGVKTWTISGEGVYPVIYEVNEQMTLWAEPRWLQRW